MGLVLTKLLPLFVYPLGAAILLGIVVLALLGTGFRRSGSTLLALGLLALWVASTPAFANWVVAQLESEYPPVPVQNVPTADAIVLLGGIVRQPLRPRVTVDLGDPVDRILQALRLYRARKAPAIVIAGGNLPWETAAVPEAELIAELLVEFGVPRSALVLETESRNTRENAVNTVAVFHSHGWRKGLLVTSGVHMPRALAAFHAVGLEAIIPVPTDIHATFSSYEGTLNFLPDANALAETTSALKELMGRFVYRYRGWT